MAKSDVTSINKFIENSFLKKPGFAKKSRFELTVDPTDESKGNIFGNFGIESDMLKYNLISITLPEITLQDNAAPFSHGITRRGAPGNISLRFYESESLDIKRFFTRWVEQFNITFNWRQYEVLNFFDDLILNMTVSHLATSSSIKDENRRVDYFEGCFPLSVGNIDYNIGSENELATIDVTMKYLFHTVTTQDTIKDYIKTT